MSSNIISSHNLQSPNLISSHHLFSKIGPDKYVTSKSTFGIQQFYFILWSDEMVDMRWLIVRRIRMKLRWFVSYLTISTSHFTISSSLSCQIIIKINQKIEIQKWGQALWWNLELVKEMWISYHQKIKIKTMKRKNEWLDGRYIYEIYIW